MLQFIWRKRPFAVHTRVRVSRAGKITLKYEKDSYPLVGSLLWYCAARYIWAEVRRWIWQILVAAVSSQLLAFALPDLWWGKGIVWIFLTLFTAAFVFQLYFFWRYWKENLTERVLEFLKEKKKRGEWEPADELIAKTNELNKRYKEQVAAINADVQKKIKELNGTQPVGSGLEVMSKKERRKFDKRLRARSKKNSGLIECYEQLLRLAEIGDTADNQNTRYMLLDALAPEMTGNWHFEPKKTGGYNLGMKYSAALTALRPNFQRPAEVES
jgi:hypothetical protein